MEGPEVDECARAKHGHFRSEVVSEERHFEEGIRVKNTITEFHAHSKNGQVRGPTEATLN